MGEEESKKIKKEEERKKITDEESKRKPSLTRRVSKLDDCDLAHVESTDQAVALVWNRMHAYMEEKGNQRVKELFVEIDKDKSGEIDVDVGR